MGLELLRVSSAGSSDSRQGPNPVSELSHLRLIRPEGLLDGDYLSSSVIDSTGSLRTCAMQEKGTLF